MAKSQVARSRGLLSQLRNYETAGIDLRAVPTQKQSSNKCTAALRKYPRILDGGEIVSGATSVLPLGMRVGVCWFARIDESCWYC
jgi:hypothetical protein